MDEIEKEMNEMIKLRSTPKIVNGDHLKVRKTIVAADAPFTAFIYWIRL
jgi:hypothetical protein